MRKKQLIPEDEEIKSDDTLFKSVWIFCSIVITCCGVYLFIKSEGTSGISVSRSGSISRHSIGYQGVAFIATAFWITAFFLFRKREPK